MVKLRLTRRGAKRRPIYSVVASDARSPRDGRFIEQFGFYDPAPQPALIRFDAAKLERWLKSGAQPTETVRRLISQWRRSQTVA